MSHTRAPLPPTMTTPPPRSINSPPKRSKGVATLMGEGEDSNVREVVEYARRECRMEPRVRERIENRKNVNNSKIGVEVARPEIRVPAS